jgi:WD40 repeat protein
MIPLWHSEQEIAEEDGEVELTDLDPPGKTDSGTSSWFRSTLLAWHYSSNKRYLKRYWRLASAPGILLLLVLLCTLSHGLSLPIVSSFSTALFSPARPSLALAPLPAPPLPPQDGIACLADAAWSPDSHIIAVLGYQACPRGSYVLGLINLYAVRSKHLVRQLKPDDMILLALNKAVFPSLRRSSGKQPPPDIASGDTTPPISYEHVIWSPDGQRLAVTFELTAQQPSLYGAVLMNSDGESARVLLQYQRTSTRLSTEWDLDHVASASSSARVFKPLPPAVAYHWGGNGTLVPDTLLANATLPTAPPLPPGPVGNPDGNTSFTIWQPGVAHVMSLVDSSSVYTMYTWSTDFASWSPDGRYLVDGIGLSGLLQPPGQLFPSRKAFVNSGLEQAPLLPIHDAVLLSVITSTTTLAWSPNGHVLATYSAENIVTFYDCASGHQLASLLVHTTSPAPLAHAVVMRWSPDGSRLLLSSVPWGLVSLWNPEHLP